VLKQDPRVHSLKSGLDPEMCSNLRAVKNSVLEEDHREICTLRKPELILQLTVPNRGEVYARSKIAYRVVHCSPENKIVINLYTMMDSPVEMMASSNRK
jgi:hypothetical protein